MLWPEDGFFASVCVRSGYHSSVMWCLRFLNFRQESLLPLFLFWRCFLNQCTSHRCCCTSFVLPLFPPLYLTSNHILLFVVSCVLFSSFFRRVPFCMYILFGPAYLVVCASERKCLHMNTIVLYVYTIYIHIYIINAIAVVCCVAIPFMRSDLKMSNPG